MCNHEPQVGSVPRLRESFHDNGKMDMVASMRAYHAIGFTGLMRPGQVPKRYGEIGQDGYTIRGRLFAAGNMRGLMQAVQRSKTNDGRRILLSRGYFVLEGRGGVLVGSQVGYVTGVANVQEVLRGRRIIIALGLR